MKKIYLILTVMMFAFSLNAQYIYNDFDANQNDPFSGWPNVPTVVANPDASGINTSANVAEFIRSQEQYAHAICEVVGTIDFTETDVFELKVHSPIACTILFKLEGSNGEFTEVSQEVSTTNVWTQLSFDFAGAQSGVYNKIVIFFDFANTVDNTFYFDDVTGPVYNGDGPPDPISLPVTFDDDEVNYGLLDFGGNASEIVVDPTDETNKVAKSIKTEAAETWAGTTVGGTVGFDAPIAFAEGSTTMTVRVWSPLANIPIRLKVEDANNVEVTCETEAMTTVANDWQTLSFDFSNEAPGTAELNFSSIYNKASMFFNFGTTGADAGELTFYWDDMEFNGGGGEEKPLMAADVQDNFENDGWGTITDWAFQDPDLGELPIVADPMDANNNVADYNRSGAFPYTNAQFILDHRMDLSVRNEFELKVYFPSTNDYTGDMPATAAIKLQNSLLGGDAWTTQTEVVLNIDEFDTWETLTFDFAGASDRTDYDQVVVQLGGEGHTVAGQFYFDDIMLLNPAGIFEQNIIKMNVYPNPATDVLYIKNSADFADVTIYSISGQMIIKTNEVNNSIDISNLVSGMYTMQATDIDGQLYQTKFIVK